MQVHDIHASTSMSGVGCLVCIANPVSHWNETSVMGLPNDGQLTIAVLAQAL